MNSLSSITASYTDSEGEDHNEGLSTTTEQLSPPFQNSDQSNSTPTKPRSKNLVSYHDDTVVSDDDQSERTISESPVEEKKEIVLLPDENDVDLPPEPQGRCSFELQEKIKKLYDDMQNKRLDMNLEIQLRKEFRNPSIYEKLIQYCGINEFGTNYAPELYDPLRWNKSSYYDDLAKVQRAEMEAREKERKEKTKVEFIMGTAKKVQTATTIIIPPPDDDKKRKSKWDQVATTASSVPKITGPLTTTVSGTKGTIISAFGSLNKKPRL